ncbi:F-box/kelch-repeat protein At3g06240-like [Papaver somniferum]|uniref:F-box/kelch-repeat protein At3g06240-like n=1 Tax=Papaver somniferum TaxID=3469 RepID=UPI000E6F910A|nr:F-box/kelch-repeat protein At3g06240-like [Papaver somniferum]XP_026412970.1 F-box/kelch-repeat protein At3g06240-like [Papaver somniferum]
MRRSNREIPEEICLEILIRLPVKSILKCKSVCKSWLSLISKPNFAKLHLDIAVQRKNSRSLILRGQNELIYSRVYDESLKSTSFSEIEEDFVVGIEDYPFKSSGYKIKLIGSCNGLVCLLFYDDDLVSSMGEENFCVWNPGTKEFKKIHFQLSNSVNFQVCVYAFSYDAQNDSYKLLRLAFGGGVNVYTLGSNSWKTIPAGNYIWLSYGNEVLVNGYLHWLAISGSRMIIVSLDISNEEFKEIQLPVELVENKRLNIIADGVLEGCLYLLVKVDEVGVEFWVMQDYGFRESWTKRYVITNEIVTNGRCLSILWNFKNGEILFMEDGGLILYDPKHESAIERKLTSLTGVTSEKKYFETFVSLNSGTYMGRGQIEESDES